MHLPALCYSGNVFYLVAKFLCVVSGVVSTFVQCLYVAQHVVMISINVSASIKTTIEYERI